MEVYVGQHLSFGPPLDFSASSSNSDLFHAANPPGSHPLNQALSFSNSSLSSSSEVSDAVAARPKEGCDCLIKSLKASLIAQLRAVGML